MVTHRMSTDNVENFVNEHLMHDLQIYESELNKMNSEIMEYMQLKSMISTILQHENEGQDKEFKTQVNIGGNMFMKARAIKTNNLLVDVGLKVYVEFTIDEALRFVDLKIKILSNQADIIRQKSIETKANIKLALLVIGDSERLHTLQDTEQTGR
ncbi:protein UXT homolog [Anopheles nili]|uniref:protein UXT homolog n=1 Tax=Anopheles nili TaxID=185578 RepID=UPI00237AE6AD|nr:protein UXT homolog [Anopheles nili]